MGVYGCVGVWVYGVLWVFGCSMGAYGCMGVWVYGRDGCVGGMGVRVYGCMGVWDVWQCVWV
jgi:hypothetical protein